MNKNEILAQLNRITNSAEFVSKPVICSLLSYLVNEYLEGRGDQIKGYSIGIDVFDQSDNFDPDQNALVRINVGRLRRLLKMYYLEDGVNDPLKIDIPTGNYKPIISQHMASSSIQSNQDEFTHLAKKSKLTSITVLPFKNLTNNDDLEYFCFGFSQELSSSLTKFDDLSVIGTTLRPRDFSPENSHLQYIKKQKIGYIIDGDIKSMGPHLKLSIQLIDVSENIQIWGSNFKFNIEEDNLFDVQENIALQLANTLGGEFGQINQKKYVDLVSSKVDGYCEQTVLLKWYFYQTGLTPESHQDLYDTLIKSLSEEPDSGLLNALLANIYGNEYTLDFPDSEGAFEKFGELAEKAFALNPRNQIVRIVLAFKAFMFDERERFFHLAEDGLKWAPNSPMRLGTLAMYICLYGEWEKGKELLDRIFANNLEFPLWLYGVTCLYHYRKFDYDSALIEANNYHIPQLFWGPMLRAAVLGQLGKLGEADRHIVDLLSIRPDFKEKARYLISRYVKETSLVEHVIEGLQKAGVKIK
jgi:TolB-like protein